MDTFATSLEPVMTVDEVVAFEQRIAAGGTSLATLMERAGSSLAEAARELADEDAKTCVLCGSGNNGGDGWVAARLLAAAGVPVTLVTKRVASELKAEPAHDEALVTMKRIADGLLVDVLVAPTAEALGAELEDSRLVIDAILGTGFDGDTVREPYASWISLANEFRKAGKVKTLACDVPSGLSARSGKRAIPCVEADATVTMLAVKTGLLEEGAGECTGTIRLAPLGIEPE